MRQKGRKTRYPGVTMIGDGKAEIRFQYTDPKTGRAKTVEKILHVASAEEASVRRAELRAEYLQQVSERERIRLSAFAEKWLRGKLNELKESTIERYAATLDHHVIPQLGDYFLDAITHHDIIRWRDAQDAKPSTINSRLRVLKTLLADAAQEHDLPRDPSARVSAVREPKTHDDDHPNSLTSAELGVLLEGVREHRPKYYPLVAVLAFTGARIGEATSLRWEDIVPPHEDAAGRHVPGRIKIRRAQHLGEVDTTKTETMRTVPLPAELWAILADHRRHLGTWGFRFDQRDKMIAKRTPRELAALQEEALREGWVFPNPKAGGPMSTKVLRKPFNQVLDYLESQGNDVQRITVHGLRRTLNNLLRQEVTDKVVVRSMIGHVTEKMTEHYSHVAVAEKEEALAQVFSIVRQKNDSPPSISPGPRPARRIIRPRMPGDQLGEGHGQVSG